MLVAEETENKQANKTVKKGRVKVAEENQAR